MIYTVTLNPSLDYLIETDGLKPYRTNRTRSELLVPGGKGLNVSLVLRELGFSSTVMGFLAGFTGKAFLQEMDRLALPSSFLWAEEGFTRINVKLKSIEGTEINGRGPVISPKELEQFMTKLQNLQNGDILHLAGSIPTGLPHTLYGDICAQLASREILTIVDASGPQLTAALPCHPFLIKPNLQELEEIFRLSPGYFTASSVKGTYPDSAVPLDPFTADISADNGLPESPFSPDTLIKIKAHAEQLQAMGARNVMISMGGAGAALLTDTGDFYHHPAPKGKVRNTVGAGDSMIAGFLAGWLESKDYRTAFRTAVAAGSASAFCEYLPSRAEILTVLEGLKE